MKVRETSGILKSTDKFKKMILFILKINIEILFKNF